MSMDESMKERDDGRWPTFLVAGAPKAGTTSVYHYLQQHPDVFMSPVKEPHYFSFEDPGSTGAVRRKLRMHGVTPRREDYLKLFSGVRDEKAIGEASTGYLLSAIAPGRIRSELPQAKIIIMLRNPADRAFSGYLMQLRNSREKTPLASAFERGKVYVENSFYYDNLARYYRYFPREQIAIYLFDDFNRQPAEVMKQIYGFIGVDEGFSPELHQHNRAWVPRYKFLNSVRARLLRSAKLRKLLSNTRLKSLFRRLTRGEPPTFPEKVRRDLLSIYREDITRVQELTGLDLSHWLEP